VRLENVTKKHWSLVALNSISFENRDGELLTLLGPSGAGKTTSLNFQRSFPVRILIGRIDQKMLLQPKL
jgi:ABC-type sugar transport system ATPase subunit